MGGYCTQQSCRFCFLQEPDCSGQESSHSVLAGPSSSRGRATTEHQTGVGSSKNWSTVDTRADRSLAGSRSLHKGGALPWTQVWLGLVPPRNDIAPDSRADRYLAGSCSLHKGRATTEHQHLVGATSNGNRSTTDTGPAGSGLPQTLIDIQLGFTPWEGEELTWNIAFALGQSVCLSGTY